jgi:hypothetical protein
MRLRAVTQGLKIHNVIAFLHQTFQRFFFFGGKAKIEFSISVC